MTASKPVLCTIQVTLQDNPKTGQGQPTQPSIGEDGGSTFVSLSGTNTNSSTAVSSFQDKGQGLLIEWTLTNSAKSWGADTEIVAVIFATKKGQTGEDVLFAYEGDQGGTFSPVAKAGDVFGERFTWAPPEGAQADTTVLLLSASTWKVSVNTKTLPSHFMQKYKYRIYFYTPTIGIWFRDPEVDISPPRYPAP